MELGGIEGYSQLGVGESSGLCFKSINNLPTVYITRETCSNPSIGELGQGKEVVLCKTVRLDR